MHYRPMDIHFVPPELSGLKNPIGMMCAPGLRRPLEHDLDELLKVHQARLLVTLVSPPELDTLHLRRLPEELKKRHIEPLYFPIDNFGTPDSLKKLDALVSRVLNTANSGNTPVLHCWAGLGRTGLVAASCLVACGFDPLEAIRTVRRLRPRTIENEDQEDFVIAYAGLLRANALQDEGESER